MKKSSSEVEGQKSLAEIKAIYVRSQKRRDLQTKTIGHLLNLLYYISFFLGQKILLI